MILITLLVFSCTCIVDANELLEFVGEKLKNKENPISILEQTYENENYKDWDKIMIICETKNSGRSDWLKTPVGKACNFLTQEPSNKGRPKLNNAVYTLFTETIQNTRRNVKAHDFISMCEQKNKRILKYWKIVIDICLERKHGQQRGVSTEMETGIIALCRDIVRMGTVNELLTFIGKKLQQKNQDELTILKTAYKTRGLTGWGDIWSNCKKEKEKAQADGILLEFNWEEKTPIGVACKFLTKQPSLTDFTRWNERIANILKGAVKYTRFQLRKTDDVSAEDFLNYIEWLANGNIEEPNIPRNDATMIIGYWKAVIDFCLSSNGLNRIHIGWKRDVSDLCTKITEERVIHTIDHYQ